MTETITVAPSERKDEPEWSSLHALWALRDDRTLSRAEKLIAVMLVAHTNEGGTCHPSIRKLATDALTSPGAVRRALLRFEAGAGPIAVHVQRGRHKTTKGGGADTHLYTLSLRGSLSGSLSGGWDQADPTLGSAVPRGWDQADPRGGITGDHEEDLSKRISEEDNEGDPPNPRKRGQENHPPSSKKKNGREETEISRLHDYWLEVHECVLKAYPVMTKRAKKRKARAWRSILEAVGFDGAKIAIDAAFDDSYRVQTSKRYAPWEIAADLHKLLIEPTEQDVPSVATQAPAPAPKAETAEERERREAEEAHRKRVADLKRQAEEAARRKQRDEQDLLDRALAGKLGDSAKEDAEKVLGGYYGDDPHELRTKLLCRLQKISDRQEAA